MLLKQQINFKTTQDWNNYIALNPSPNGQELLNLRIQCYKRIEKIRKKPLLVYAAKFLNITSEGVPNSIDLTDIAGFTDLVNSIQDSKSIDILLHSPGGNPDATERIVSIIRDKFQNVSFLIPHSAYSAATMLALSGNEIILHPSAVLGPIDPQFDGIPARSIKRGFEKAKKTILKEGPNILPAYLPLIEKYSLHLLEICEDSEKLAKNLVKSWLSEYMLKNTTNKTNIINKSVRYFSNYDKHLLHSRPLDFQKLKKLNLNIQKAQGLMVDYLWEAIIQINGLFDLTPFTKLYETTNGVSWGKLFHIKQQPSFPQNQKS